MAGARVSDYRERKGQATTPMETGMKLKHAAAVVVALLVIASLATWMFAGEDPPLQDEPVLEAG